MDDRIALRLGALRLARRRGRTRDAAWAAARLRLAGVSLAPGEARFAREMRVKLGHALRSARLRRAQPVGPNAALPGVLAEPRSRRRQLIVAAVGALLLLGALLLYMRLQESAGSPEGAPPSQEVVIATPPPPLRGRTQPGVAAPVTVVQATPAPTAGPPATPAPGGSGTGTAGGGTGAGGSGGGTGTGNGRATPTPTPKPTPTPSPSPTPVATVPPDLVTVTGRVVDTFSFAELAGVCVTTGGVSASECHYTDAHGNFSFVLDRRVGSTYTFRFIVAGYADNPYTFNLQQLAPPYDTGTHRLRPQ
jgi:hypothetical protein